jgi:hypothetical protein
VNVWVVSYSPLPRNTLVPHPTPRVNFAHLISLKVHCLRKILSVVCTLADGAFSRNTDLKHGTSLNFALIPQNTYEAISSRGVKLITNET